MKRKWKSVVGENREDQKQKIIKTKKDSLINRFYWTFCVDSVALHNK